MRVHRLPRRHAADVEAARVDTQLGLVETAQSMGRRAMLGAAAALQRHRRRVAVAVSVLLAGTALTAFGIAPMAPDAAQLPRRQIIEPIEPAGLPAQLLALASYDMVLSRADQTRASDNVESLLRRLGVFDPQLATFMRANNDTRRLFEGRPGKQVQARVSVDGQPLELVARFAPPSTDLANTQFTRLTITRNGDQWRADSELAKLDTQVRVAGGTIQTSLFAATDEARLSDQIAIQMVELFAGDIDFHRELHRGDTFSVVYEFSVPMASRSPGPMMRAVSGRRVRQRYRAQQPWYAEDNVKGGYYGFDGQSRRRAFPASPMAFSRVTSASMRMHPIQHLAPTRWRRLCGPDGHRCARRR
jgi:hypothetical protein